jgi:hypothetical protein
VERFYPASSWEVVYPAVDGFVRGQYGVFGVRTQNDDSTYKSGWEYDSLQIPVAFDTAAFTAIDTNKIRVAFDSDTMATGLRLRPFIYSGTDTSWADSINFNASANYDTITGLSLNKKYDGKVQLKHSARTKYYSALDSARTWSWQVISVSITFTTDTSFTATVTKHATMPANSGYYAADSTRIAADCTAVYLDPDSSRYFSTISYRSAAHLSGTYTLLNEQLIPGAILKFRVFSTNVDSLGND